MGDFGFEFPKRSQLLIGVHNETLSVVAVRVNNPDRTPLRINDTQPQLQPAWLRLSAMIFQYFT